MNRVILKIVLFLLVVVLIGSFNTYMIQGPLFEQNTELAVRQFDAKLPPPTGDCSIGGISFYWSNVCIVEVLLLTCLAAFFFVPSLVNVIVGSSTKG